MGIQLNKESYQKLINENIEALEKYMPEHSLEKKHTIEVLKWSVEKIYGETKKDNMKLNDKIKIYPIGLKPKKIHEEHVKIERFNEVCGAISRYYNKGLKINVSWVEEYNELVESVQKHYEKD